MMGSRQGAQGALFHEISLESHVPVDHPIPSIDRFVDIGDIRRHITHSIARQFGPPSTRS